MACYYRIHPEKNLLHYQFSGHVSAKDSFEIQDDVDIDPDRHPDLNILADLRGLTGVDLGVIESSLLAAKVQANRIRKGHRHRQALLYDSRLVAGMIHLYRMQMARVPEVEVKGFRDPAEALDFVDLGPQDRFLLGDAPVLHCISGGVA